MKSKAKVISLLLTLLISMSFVLQGVFEAAESNDVVKVSVSNKPTVDIVLSSKETSVDLQNFERDVINKLKELGIDTSNIQFQTAETKQFNSNNSNAEQIFNSWRIFPDNYDAQWYYDSTSKKVVCPIDAWGETGFIDDKNSYQNFTMEATIHATQLSQPEGLVFRMYEDEKTGRWNMYWLWCSGDRFTEGAVNRVIALVNYPLSKANGLPASSTSQPTISTGVNSGCTSPICILLSYAICRNPSAKIFSSYIYIRILCDTVTNTCACFLISMFP